MNRTAPLLCPAALCTALLAVTGAAQQPPPTPEPAPQDATASKLVETLRQREAAVKSVLLELVTEGLLPGGLEFTTRGTLRVLRTAQGDVAAVQANVDYTFADGLTGRMESVKTPEGVTIFEQNPTFGEVLVRLDAALVADIEWAGKVLQRADLPGLADARAAAPLGSAMVADLLQRYQLAPLSKKDRDGQVGQWFGGDLRTGPGLEGDDPDMPLADHVELFVRDGDQALVEVVHLQAGKVVQRIRVDRLVVDGPMPIESFQLGDRGKRPREAKDHPPMWQQIEELMQRATAKADDLRAAGKLDAADAVPPSKRK